MEEFNLKLNYKEIHLEWIKRNPSFRPKGGLPPNVTYFNYMNDMYRDTIKQQKTAYIYLRDDYKHLKSRNIDVNHYVAAMFGDKPDETQNSFFVTFNFDPKLFNPIRAIADVRRLFDKSWVDQAYGVFEFHTENGNHPHFMMKLTVNKYNKKGKLLDKMAESTLAKMTSGKNFIDVKPFLPCHQDYLELDKDPSKKEYLEKDIIWRKENNLPEYLEKKNL